MAALTDRKAGNYLHSPNVTYAVAIRIECAVVSWVAACASSEVSAGQAGGKAA